MWHGFRLSISEIELPRSLEKMRMLVCWVQLGAFRTVAPNCGSASAEYRQFESSGIWVWPAPVRQQARNRSPFRWLREETM